VGWELVGREVHDELHGVSTVRRGQLKPGIAGQRRVEQVQQRGLHVGRGDDGGGLDSLAVLEHDRPGAATGGVDPGDDRTCPGLAAPVGEPMLASASVKSCDPPRGCHCPLPVIGSLSVHDERPPGWCGPAELWLANDEIGCSRLPQRRVRRRRGAWRQDQLLTVFGIARASPRPEVAPSCVVRFQCCRTDRHGSAAAP